MYLLYRTGASLSRYVRLVLFIFEFSRLIAEGIEWFEKNAVRQDRSLRVISLLLLSVGNIIELCGDRAVCSHQRYDSSLPALLWNGYSSVRR